MKIVRNDLAFSPFILMELEQGTYEGKLYPVFAIAFAKSGRERWLSFYVLGKGIQLIYSVACKCRMCRFNRLRALFFLRPYNAVEWKEIEEEAKKWISKWTQKNS